MTIVRIVALLAALIPARVSAEALADNGNTLLSTCENSDIGHHIACMMYIVGAYDGAHEREIAFNLKPEICIPPNVTYQQMSDVVIKFLKEYPAIRHLPAVSLVHAGLLSTFRCP